MTPGTRDEVVAGSDADDRTPAEISEYRTTPDLEETLAFVRRLSAAHPERLRFETFGRSGEGRDLTAVLCSGNGDFDPASVHASGRAVLLVQNAIHAGEMDGKDACLALLRDLLNSADGRRLLERVVLVVIPVYNVDGHERRSAFHRMNQNGPETMGWRANATNLNLNRDYLKAQAPETRAFLRLFHRWLPDFFVDNHVTDGADFEYDVTFRIDATPDVYPPTAAWIRDAVTPELVRRVDAAGHLAFPDTLFLADDTDPAQGFEFSENPPRFSTGQMILENRPGLLVELHMLKDYRTRVTGDYAILRAVLEVMHRDASRLVALNRDADRQAATLADGPSGTGPFPLALAWNGETSAGEFRGREYTRFTSDVSGAMAVRYDSRPRTLVVPMRTSVKVDTAVRLPAGYIVPPQWTEVIDVLIAHDVEILRTTGAWTGSVERYRCSGMVWPSRPFEGRFPILRGGNVESEMGHFGNVETTTKTTTFPARSVVVPLRQRLAKVAIHWLEPQAPDSAVRWGFFAPIFEQKESAEAYMLEPYAAEQLAKDSALRTEYETRARSDPAFAGNPAARLDFFYQRSPWGRANRVGEYPVGRLLSLDGLPVG
jgi:hypothetical protein